MIDQYMEAILESPEPDEAELDRLYAIKKALYGVRD